MSESAEFIKFELGYLNFILKLAESNGDSDRVDKIKKEIQLVQSKSQNKVQKKTKKICSCRRELC